MSKENIKMILLLMILLISLIIFKISASGEKEDIKEAQNINLSGLITPEEYLELKEKEPSLTLIDVRTEEEYESGYIEGAINIPLSIIEKEIIKTHKNKDDVIVLYCRSGNRSNQAFNKLAKLGYTRIYDLGGIIDWPFEIIK